MKAMYKWKYETPEGFSNMLMNSDGEYLTGLWFEGSRDVSKHIMNCEEKRLQFRVILGLKYILYNFEEWRIYG